MQNDQSSALSADTSSRKMSLSLVQYLLLALVPVLAFAQAAVAGATPTIMRLMITANQAHTPSRSTCTPPRTMMMDVSITLTRTILFLPISLLQK
jgi:hypothetical protein